MKTTRRIILLLLITAPLAWGTAAPPPKPQPVPPPQWTLKWVGPATNTTAEVTAQMELVITIEGEKATATLRTEQPLVGSGKLEGTYRGGWCELTGKLNEGFSLRLCGVFDGKDFRGTYYAVVPGQPLQYGRVRLALKP